MNKILNKSNKINNNNIKKKNSMDLKIFEVLTLIIEICKYFQL